jgi:hypothetical protein
MVGDDLRVASTTDDQAEVNRVAGAAPAEPNPEEMAAEEREAQEIQQQRRENGHRGPEHSPKYQKRIDRLTAMRSEAEARAERAEAENAQLRQMLQEYEWQTPAHATNGQPARTDEPQPAPQPEPASTEEPFEQAPPAEQPQSSPATPRSEGAESQQQVNENLLPEHQAFLKFQESHNEKLSGILSQRPDANQLVARAAPVIQGMREDVSQAVALALQRSPNSEHVMLHLLEHPDLLHDANRLNAADAFAATLLLAGRLGATNGQPRSVVMSKAPPPISGLKGTARTETKDPGEMSLPEYRKWYDQNFGRGRR